MPTKAASKRVPKDEDPRVKFERLCVARTDKVLAAIELLGKLGAGRYERTDADTEKVFAAVKGAYDDALAIWQAPKGTKAARSHFTL